MLAAVSAWDLSLAKLYEAHTDALAIWAELAPDLPPPAGLGGVWAAEAPGFTVHQTPGVGEKITLSGKKAWCSGAACVDWALVTTWGDDTRPFLSLVYLQERGIAVDTSGWHAVGMSRVATATVQFEQVPAQIIGVAGAYLDRPGFWHGGAGIAACWYGASVSLADALAHTVKRRAREADTGATQDPFRLAHLGAVDVAMTQARALLMQTAQTIDLGDASVPHAAQSSQIAAMRLRAACELTASTVLEHVGKALGATPYCSNVRFARMSADLPVFLRQSHAEHDLAALALLAADHARPWNL
jgi:alkylation response protein AidB-like acyl-CoA dehydrogenase